MGRSARLLAVLLGAWATTATADVDWDSIGLTSHSTIQAVRPDGSTSFSTGAFPLKIQGIVLNNPEDMLDSTPNFIPWDDGAGIFQLGGQWQIFVQSVDPSDAAGTAVYMAQNYGNLPFIADTLASYSNEDFAAEVNRVGIGGTLRAGDLVEIRARAGLPFGGKFNVNEAHSTDPSRNFDVVVLQAGRGLPDPLAISIGDVKDANDGFLFDPSRATGAEHYQARLVRLDGVQLVDPSHWGAGGKLLLTDSSGRTLPLLLGINPAFDSIAAPVGSFSVVGIFDQETFGPGREGYRLWVTDPAGITAIPEAGSLVLVAAVAGAVLCFRGGPWTRH